MSTSLGVVLGLGELPSFGVWMLVVEVVVDLDVFKTSADEVEERGEVTNQG